VSYIIAGYKDLLFDPIGSVSSCCKAKTRLSMQQRTAVCSECANACDIYVPETEEEFEAPEIVANGQAYYKYERDGLEAIIKHNEALGGR